MLKPLSNKAILSQWIPDNLAEHKAVIEPVVQSEPEPVAFVPQFKFRSMTEEVPVPVSIDRITPPKELEMSDVNTSVVVEDVAAIIGKVATLVESPTFQAVLPVLLGTIIKLDTNPAAAPIIGAEFVAQILPLLPNTESNVITNVVNLFAVMLAVKTPVAPATPVEPPAPTPEPAPAEPAAPAA